MEEVDEIILSSLRTVFCDISDEQNLSDLNAELMVEGVVRTLWKINPESRGQLSTYKLPPNVAAKFRMCTEISSAIKGLGFRGNIGYQSLLYGSQTEIRNILLFLIEKLPKQKVSAEASSRNALEDLKWRTAASLRTDIPQWTPWFCHHYRYKFDGRLWHPPDELETISYHPVTDWAEMPWKDLPASLLEQIETQTGSEALSPGKMQMTCAKESKKRLSKPLLPPKPLLKSSKPDEAEKAREEAEVEAVGSEDSQQQKELAEKIGRLEAEVQALSQDLEATVYRVEARRKQKSLLEHDMTTSRARDQAESAETEKLRRWMMLLENPKQSLEKLKSFHQQSELKFSKLESQWEEHRRPRLEELTNLRQNRGKLTETERLAAEIREIQAKLPVVFAEAESKQRLALELQNELSRVKKGPGRTAYTRRILEIVASVQKQREEIQRVLYDTRKIQKDINLLTGKLDRTFTATDELLFQDAKCDEQIRRAYKMIAKLHEVCADGVKSVESTGQIVRAIHDVQDQNDTESQKGTDDNLERLVNDYCLMKQENESLINKLRLMQG